MVPFGGWEMPVEYSGITAEHMRCGTRAGVFDVSHMGEIEVAGQGCAGRRAADFEQRREPAAGGQAHYSALTTFEGTFVDDMLVYRMAPNHFMMVVNASNIEKDYAWIAAQIQGGG
jgi:aminomethyltransferase